MKANTKRRGAGTKFDRGSLLTLCPLSIANSDGRGQRTEPQHFNPTLITKLLCCLLAMLAVLVWTTSTFAKGISGSTSSSTAQANLNRMYGYLREKPELRFKTSISVLNSLSKRSKQATAIFFTRQPNLFRVELAVSNAKYVYISDGKILTLYSPAARKFAQYPARDSILGTMYSAAGLLNLVTPMLDFFWVVDFQSGGSEDVKIIAIPPIMIGGRECTGVRIERFEERFEVWLQKRGSPLPCKLISRRTDGAAITKQTNLFLWGDTPAITKDTFSFLPPNGSRQVEAVDFK